MRLKKRANNWRGAENQDDHNQPFWLLKKFHWRRQRIERRLRRRSKITQGTAPHQSGRRPMGHRDCERCEIASCGGSKILAANFFGPPSSNIEPGGILQIWESSTPEFRPVVPLVGPRAKKPDSVWQISKTLDIVDKKCCDQKSRRCLEIRRRRPRNLESTTTPVTIAAAICA
jgi:hypothetical protein